MLLPVLRSGHAHVLRYAALVTLDGAGDEAVKYLSR